MAISFVRIDDRVIHGQLVTRWARSYLATASSRSMTRWRPIRCSPR